MTGLAPLDTLGWLSTQHIQLKEWVARVGVWKTFGRGQELYQADRAPDAIYGLARGCLELAVPLPDGDMASVYFAEPGFWIGESAVLARSPRTLSLSAATPCRVLRIDAQDIWRLLDREPAFWPCFYALSHANASLAIREYAHALTFSPEAHVCSMLLRLSKSSDRVSITQAKLAALLGVTRSTVQRICANLVAEGAIAMTYGAIVVLDRARLYGLMMTPSPRADAQ